jgi:hypothetical protein
MAKFSFKLRCKICGKIMEEKENPIEHIAKHAEEELLNYFDAIPTVSLK